MKKHPTLASVQPMLTHLPRLLLTAALLALWLAACSQEEAARDGQESEQPNAGQLNIYNWVEYIPEGLIDRFEQETGITVVYDTFETNEALQAKLVAGNTGYDLVVPTSTFAITQLQAGFFQPLNKAKIPNLKNLNPDFMQSVAAADPGNRYFVPWAWSFTTVGVNKTLVDGALGGEPLPENSWELVFEPRYTSRLKTCGIAFLDSPTEIFPVALHYIGKPAYSNNLEDIRAAGDVLARVRDDLRFFSNTLIDDLANRRACVVIGWSGDINWAVDIAAENGYDDKIIALLPSTGGLLFTDVMAIPADAPNVENAHRFMNFFLDPEISAWVINEVNYHTGNDPALEHVDSQLRANTSIFVSDSDMRKMIPSGSFSNATREALGEAFNNFKAGN